MPIPPEADSDAPDPVAIDRERPRKAGWRVLILLAGVIAPQFWLFGSTLIGSKVQLPLDCLVWAKFFPSRAQFADITVFDFTQADLVIWAEPARVKFAEALRHGSFPLTNPYVYCGAPDAFAPKWSLPAYVSALFPSPVTVAWVHLAIALVAGIGMYRLTRDALRVGFWAACVAAWSYPLTGFFIVWQGYGIDYAASWLPWVLWGVWMVATTGLVKYCLALIAVTWQPLMRLDVAGHALIAAGFWGAWLLLKAPDRFRKPHWWWRGGALAASVGLALALAAPYILPAFEYAKEGSRPQSRAAGIEERPPVGISAFPQLIIPACDGLAHPGWTWRGTVALPETGAAGYAGLIATLCLFPLAWSDRRHWHTLGFLLGLMILACSWLLNLGGFVAVLRLPILNSLSHNRFVFVFSACVVMGAAVGFDRLFKKDPISRRMLCAVLVVLCVCAGWSLYRAGELPALANVYGQTTCLCFIAIVALAIMLLRPRAGVWVGVVLALLQAWELLSFASLSRRPCDWSLYYPQASQLRNLASDINSRALPLDCIAPNLLEMYGLRDIRGYDGVDPQRLVKLLDTARDPSVARMSFALTMNYAPRLQIEAGEIRLPPAMQLLAVRYLILRQPLDAPGLHSLDEGEGFWIYENRRALPRAFVPAEVRESSDEQALLQLADDRFDPAKTALVTHPVSLPSAIRGSARITGESPNRVSIAAHMQTPGLAVLSDLWDGGWQARVNGLPVKVERVDYGVRGVLVPAGDSQIEMVYAPRSLTNGLIVAGAALGFLVLGTLLLLPRMTERPSPRPSPGVPGGGGMRGSRS